MSSSDTTFPLCFVPQAGQRISISFSSPINFSRNFSGPRKVTSPQAHAGHSAFTSYLFLDIFSSSKSGCVKSYAGLPQALQCMMALTGFSGLSAQSVLFHLEPLVTAHLLSHKTLGIAVSPTRTMNQLPSLPINRPLAGNAAL